ncbi:MAG: hypothetical protein JO166_07840 [Deltaproteobacteria bacterium]|nr:hypothetical protein [Deltaproteobacteria bacterium]
MYRELAIANHPDRNPTDRVKQETMKAVNRLWDAVNRDLNGRARR